MVFRRRTSLAVKLTILIAASAGLIFILMILFNYFFLKKTYIAQARETAKLLGESKAQKVSLILARAEGVAATLAPIVAGGTRSEAELTQLLKDAVHNNPEISAMAVAFEPSAYQPGLRYFSPYVYRQGTAIQQSYLGSSAYNYFNWRWYEVPQELNRALWSEPYQEPTSDTTVITYSAPFYRDEQGQKVLQGVVAASINLAWLQDIVAAAKIFDHGYAFLLSRQGVFITVPQKEWSMNQNINFVATLTDNPELRQVGEKMKAGAEGFVRIRDIFHDQASWLYFAPFPVSGFSMGIVIPENELFAGLYRLSQRLVAICLAGLLFLVLVAVLISRKITRPIRLLERSAAAIAEGNLDTALPRPASRDEIGSLTRSFQEMQEALKEYMANLAAATAAKERIESELKIGRAIQMNFLPKKFPPLPAGDFVEISRGPGAGPGSRRRPLRLFPGERPAPLFHGGRRFGQGRARGPVHGGDQDPAQGPDRSGPGTGPDFRQSQPGTGRGERRLDVRHRLLWYPGSQNRGIGLFQCRTQSRPCCCVRGRNPSGYPCPKAFFWEFLKTPSITPNGSGCSPTT